MRILFLVPYPQEGASNRYRVEQYLPYLKREGIRYSLRPFWSACAYRSLYKNGHYFRKLFFFMCGTTSRIFQIFGIAGYDLVFIHREAYPIGGAFFETIISILKKPIIFDFDDAIFLPASSRPNNFIERFKNPNKVASIIKRSKYVISGNSFLADFALRYNRSITVIPTPIDTDKYYPDNRSPGNKIVIGWIGSATTLDFLKSMREVFVRLSKEFSNIRFKIVGGDFSILGLSNIISKPWSLVEEIEDLKGFDIGIMPMPDNDWTSGKCGFKAILYMSMGIPCVCSAVGVNKEIILDGNNGFLANSEEEWIKKLSLLVRDAELRKRLGDAGRKTAIDRYSLKANAPKYLDVLKKAYGKNSAKT
ncbi:MAG: Glycosyl transferase group 1 [Parcubacteria group bacterium GW2011_GWC2_38_7]|nr:MAG: Glycosyl transferase group 1 [Parcubacteria group bacterium GW2011_GWC2_38_7]